MKFLRNIAPICVTISISLTSVCNANTLFDAYLSALKNDEFAHIDDKDFSQMQEKIASERQERIAAEHMEQLIKDSHLSPSNDSTAISFDVITQPLLQVLSTIQPSTIVGLLTLTEWMSQPSDLEEKRTAIDAALHTPSREKVTTMLKQFDTRAQEVFFNNVIHQWIMYATLKQPSMIKRLIEPGLTLTSSMLANTCVYNATNSFLSSLISNPVSQFISHHLGNSWGYYPTQALLGWGASWLGLTILPSLALAGTALTFSSSLINHMMGKNWAQYKQYQTLEGTMNSFYTDLKTIVELLPQTLNLPPLPTALPTTLEAFKIVGHALRIIGMFDAALSIANAIDAHRLTQVTLVQNKNQEEYKQALDTMWNLLNNTTCPSQLDTTQQKIEINPSLEQQTDVVKFITNLILAHTLGVTTTQTPIALPAIELSKMIVQTGSIYTSNFKKEYIGNITLAA